MSTYSHILAAGPNIGSVPTCSVAVSTALEKTSSWRTATEGTPNLACTISPCEDYGEANHNQVKREDSQRRGKGAAQNLACTISPCVK